MSVHGGLHHRVMLTATIVLVVFLAAAFVMAVTSWLGAARPPLDRLIDAAALSVLCGFALFWLVLVPLRRAGEAVRASEERLRRLPPRPSRAS